MIPEGMTVVGSFWTGSPGEALSALEALARIDPAGASHDPTGRAVAAIHVDLGRTGPDRFFRALRENSVRLVRSFLHASYGSEFWSRTPEECVGAVLGIDGHVAMADPRDYGRIIPLERPLAIRSRPVADAEDRGPAPHVVRAGGLPFLSDGLLKTLRDLGAAGETAEIVYQGPKRSEFGKVQAGYRRFHVLPEIDTGGHPPIDLLPAPLGEDFGICGFRRSRGEDAWIEVALDRRAAEALRARRRTVLLRPIFSRDGAVADFRKRVEESARDLGSDPLI